MRNCVFTQEMVQHSLISVGNTERILKAIHKARCGKAVSLVYLGGSITEGALAEPRETNCFAFLSAQIFRQQFMSNPALLQYHNAGISGTPSLLGITRCEQDVLQHSPDIVFVEFAVNDSDEMKNKLAYESLIRKLLSSKTHPAVVLIFTRMEKGYTAQPHMQLIGQHYQLGMISVGNAINPELENNHMQWSDYSSDYAHPTTEGHQFIAEMITHYCNTALRTKAEPYIVPEATVFGNDLESLHNIRKDDPCILDTGSFTYSEDRCYSYQNGWVHAENAPNHPAVFGVTGTHMTIAFKQENDNQYGRAEVYVNDQCEVVLPGYSEKGWGNVVTELIAFHQPGKQNIQIKMHEEDCSKKFTLLDIAVADATKKERD